MGATSGFHTANIKPDVERLVGALDAQASATGVMRLREWAHGELAARPGERALDVGSGTGSETQVLASAVTPGLALGVEPNPGLRAVACARASEAGNTAYFVAGDATCLPTMDGRVDIVWCERVFQHLSEPERAAAEIARVLAPGGRAAVLDTDWATTILHPGDPAIVADVIGSALHAAANPYAGRELVGHLTAAGLDIDDVGSQALIQPHDEVPWPLVRMMTGAALRRSAITEAQRDQLFEDLTAAAARGALHMSVTMFGVIAHKPR
jgi:ubiquinone/menaquinone biosynthesis C-methylase UbiE